jgi:carbon storage regulator CsrA
MCPNCAEKWIAHVTEVIGTADGQAWCCEERTESGSQDVATGNQADEAGSGLGLMEGPGMLVLSRKKGEAIVVGDDITVTVLQIRGDRVQVGIEAPDKVKVLRNELERWGKKDATTQG